MAAHGTGQMRVIAPPCVAAARPVRPQPSSLGPFLVRAGAGSPDRDIGPWPGDRAPGQALPAAAQGAPRGSGQHQRRGRRRRWCTLTRTRRSAGSGLACFSGPQSARRCGESRPRGGPKMGAACPGRVRTGGGGGHRGGPRGICGMGPEVPRPGPSALPPAASPAEPRWQQDVHGEEDHDAHPGR
jgi:hypothetical protein